MLPKNTSLLPSVDLLKKHFAYDPETGVLVWKWCSDFGPVNTKMVGKPAGTMGTHGYVSIIISRHHFYAHRIIWALINGNISPEMEVDHIDGDRANNRIQNLRAVPAKANLRNARLSNKNTSGVPGVWRSGDRWAVTINGGSERQYFGTFATIAEAVAVRKAAEIRHGYHPNHGRAA